MNGKTSLMDRSKTACPTLSQRYRWRAQSSPNKGRSAKKRNNAAASRSTNAISRSAIANADFVGLEASMKKLSDALKNDSSNVLTFAYVAETGGLESLLYGMDDTAVPPKMSRGYAKAARAAGDAVEHVPLARTGHMDCLDPASAAHAALCKWLGRFEPCPDD